MANDTSRARSTALVTGASSGIGREFARCLARAGHDIIVVARRENALAELKKEIEALGVAAHVLPLDLSVPGAAQHLFDAVRAGGWSVDVLINNAGFGALGAFAEAKVDRQTEMIQVNIIALTELARLFGGAMVERKRGHVVNIGSTAGFVPGPFMAVYYATKAYVNSFSQALSREWRRHGVTVTVVCPGPTASEFQHKADMDMSGMFRRRQLPSSEDVAEFGFRAMRSGTALAIHGWKNKLLIQILRVAPRAILPWVIERMQAPDKAAPESVA